MDDTYDVGLIRMRDLTITKTATNGLNGAPVTGAESRCLRPVLLRDDNITVTGMRPRQAPSTAGADGTGFTSGDGEPTSTPTPTT